MIHILQSEPLLRLFVAAALGFLLGRISFFGFRLGVAAVLFASLGLGALGPGMELPEIVHLLGLALFVYTFGLASGEVFFASLRAEGLRDNLLVIALLLVGAGVAVGADALLGLAAPMTAGLFCGGLTCTPALAATVQSLREHGQPGAVAVVGYSLAYPVSVLGTMACISAARRLWKPDDAAEAAASAARGVGIAGGRLVVRTVCVSNPLVKGVGTWELQETSGIDVVFGRIRRGGRTLLPDRDTLLDVGDLVTIIGLLDHVDRATAFLGEPSEETIALDRREFDYHRVFISNPGVAGRTLAELDLPGNFGAIVTRLRRGDVEFVPHGGTRLELGDRARVVAPPGRMDEVVRSLGDSYRRVSEVDGMSLGLGIAIGLLVGMIPIPLPGGVTFKMGAAGGPLLTALVLGRLRRTGPLIWALPYGANLTIRQIGLILFLAGVGSRAGHAFASTVAGGGVLSYFAAAAAIAVTTAALTLFVGHRLLGIPFGRLCGVLAGLQTQTALLAYSQEQTRNDLPNVGYASVYPIAVIVKIAISQLMLAYC